MKVPSSAVVVVGGSVVGIIVVGTELTARKAFVVGFMFVVGFNGFENKLILKASMLRPGTANP